MTLEYSRSDVVLRLKGQDYRVNKCIFHLVFRSITQQELSYRKQIARQLHKN